MMTNEQIIEEDEINLLDHWRVIIKRKALKGSIASGFMFQLGGGLGGLASGFLGINTPVDQWLAILKSLRDVKNHNQNLI